MKPVTEEIESRPLRADARRNRERILAAARRCFAEQGYETQMGDVAEKAGVGVGTVYRHFPDKSALVEALVEERFLQFKEGADRALETDDIWEGFRDWLTECAEIQADDKMVCDFLTDAVGAERPSVIAQEVGLRAATEAVIERAKAAGAIRDHVQADDVPSMMRGLGAVARSDLDPDGRLWRRQLEFVLEGMRNPAYEPRG